MISLKVEEIDWPLHQPFIISREIITSIRCIQVTLKDADGNIGRGEAVGIDYAGETPATMINQIEKVRSTIETGATRSSLQQLLPHGGARNAIDCAFWDLEAKFSGVPAWQAADLASFDARPTAFSFGIMEESSLRETARQYTNFSLIKVKTNKELGLDPVRILHEELPNSKFIIDPNQAWGRRELLKFALEFETLNVILLEQPVAVADDELLRELSLPVPIAADEAFNSRQDIDDFDGKYQVLNIKLDKTGGLTEALACAAIGKKSGFGLMVGCMIGSSLSMAPGMIIAQMCDFVDLDGPLLQSADVEQPIIYKGGMILPPTSELWG
jgi:L-Ala-D/L-Glu epimerase